MVAVVGLAGDHGPVYDGIPVAPVTAIRRDPITGLPDSEPGRLGVLQPSRRTSER
jgi:hypothetical protein